MTDRREFAIEVFVAGAWVRWRDGGEAEVRFPDRGSAQAEGRVTFGSEPWRIVCAETGQSVGT